MTDKRRTTKQILADRWDGLMRELDYLEKRRLDVQKQIIEINMQIAPRWPE